MSDSHRSRWSIRLGLGVVALLAGVGAAAFAPAQNGDRTEPDPEQIARGRELVMHHACGGCHGGADPSSEGWLVGVTRPEQEWLIGPCLFDADATPCFRTRPRNLTPHNTTGMGRFSERQIFNALRYGLRPGETADVEITSTVPGEGNFPMSPKYMAPPMPWPAWRHLPDEDLWAIAAYLKHGLKPVENRVADSEGPPDFWASEYTEEALGPRPAVPFPTAREKEPSASGVDRDQVLLGRQLVISHDCGACHSGGTDPRSEGWLAGVTERSQEFPVGPCAVDPGAEPCFWMRPRNLTPDRETGLGGYSDRQIFNALRFGLRPSAATDVEISAAEPGVGHFPEQPDYMGPGMPWMYWRHMKDEELWAIVAYLRHGVRAVSNEVAASDAPPEGWASEYTVDKIGPMQVPSFPTANEVKE